MFSEGIARCLQRFGLGFGVVGYRFHRCEVLAYGGLIRK